MLEAIFVSGINEIKVSGLYQWDRGQMLQITCPDLPSEFQVHFAKRKSKTTIDVQAESADNVATVAIPDELLQEPFDLYAYLYFDEGLIGETVKTIRMPIKPRVKPDDYVIDLPQEQMTEAEKLVEKMIGAYSVAAANQPIIRNGTWWTWDVSVEDYVDTGTTAKGEKGDTGAQGPQGVQGATGPQGAQGIQGETGPQGEKGETGAKGDKGDTGATGPQGPKGDTGAGFKVLDYYASLSALETAVTSPNIGDAYGVGTADPYDIYIYGESAGWVNNGPLQGAKGDQGEKGDAFTYEDFTEEQLAALIGPQGPQGEKGDTGAKGDKGDTGATGPQGAQGIQGVQGEKGETGATGAQGPQGVQGEQGPAGYTPVKGTDYFTEADKAELVNAVLANFTDVSEVGA